MGVLTTVGRKKIFTMRERVKGKLNFIKESLSLYCTLPYRRLNSKGLICCQCTKYMSTQNFELRSSRKEVNTLTKGLSRPVSKLYESQKASLQRSPVSVVIAAGILCKESARQVSLPVLCKIATQPDRQCYMSGMT